MYVVKRSGKVSAVHFDKITNRVVSLADGLSDACDPYVVAQKVIQGIHPGCTTEELDALAAETAASMTTHHPDYAVLAARLAVASLHDSTQASFAATMKSLYENVNSRTGECNPLIADDVYAAICKNADALDAAIDFECDFNYDYFGFKTLERSYLLRQNDQIVERPQHMLMRVAVGIHKENVDAAIATYKLLARGVFTHATPTLFNAGTPQPQMSSCFLVAMKEDSITGIYDTLKECALISKSAGGIGLSVHNVRASGSYIKGLNAEAYGLVPMLRVFNDTARFVTQGGGKRKGSFAIYLEPWHADVFDFLELRKNHGKEEARARDLFYGMWIPDLFMKRTEADGMWTLMCPAECPGLADCWGEKFEELYTRYEKEGRGRKQVRAQELWAAILESQIETGMPYMLFKDAANGKSNQQHLGTIKSSNLCTEIIEYTAPDETAVCNLASLALPRFVVEEAAPADAPGTPTPSPGAGPARVQSFNWRRRSSGQDLLSVGPARSDSCQSEDLSLSESDAEADSPNGKPPQRWAFPPRRLVGSLAAGRRRFDFEAFAAVVRTATRNLNRIIDGNYYPVEEARNSNMRHRPVGLGVQGLADVFILLGLPFDSPEAAQLNKQIFETLYFSALQESCALAKEEGPHPSYEGSPVSRGVLQPDMWGVKDSESPSAGRLDWAGLRRDIAAHGVRNSLLVAPMPTASTSQILGNNECFEPYTSNMYARRVLSGEFTVVNSHLLADLMELGLWTPRLKTELIAHNGSIQAIAGIPDEIKVLYRTVWELKQRAIVDMAADRAVYIDQSQSLNVHMSNATPGKLTSLHFHAWKRGLKTGLYYLRTRAAADAVKFTVDAAVLKERNANLAGAAQQGQAGKPPVAPQQGQKEKQAQAEARAQAQAAVACSLKNRDDCLMCGS